MDVEDPKARLGYRYGARDAFEASSYHMPPKDQRAMLVWLKDLEMWNGGPPPPAPRLWSDHLKAEGLEHPRSAQRGSV